LLTTPVLWLNEGKSLGFKEIAVIIAALNEEQGIGPTLAELREVLPEMAYVVVDGRSSDRTVEVAKELGADVLIQRGHGKGSAVSEALSYVNCNPKYIVFTDGDFTYPSKYILDMVDVLEKNPNVGMVTGNRFNHLLTTAAMKNPFYIGNRMLSLAQLLLNGVNMNDPLTGLRVVRWKILENWRPKSRGFDIEAEMNHRVEDLGYRIQEVSIPYRARLGEKKLKLRHGIAIFRRIIAESL